MSAHEVHARGPAPSPDVGPGHDARSMLLTNLILLGFDAARPMRSSVLPYQGVLDGYTATEGADGETALEADMFSKSGPKGASLAFECVARFLFGRLSAAEAAERFAGCLYVLTRTDAKQFRNVAFEWISALKKNGHLRGAEVVVRRSFFDDCRGERFEGMMLALSEYVLRTELGRELGEDALPAFLDIANLRRTYGAESTSALHYSLNFQSRGLAESVASWTIQSSEFQQRALSLGIELEHRRRGAIDDCLVLEDDLAQIDADNVPDLAALLASMDHDLAKLLNSLYRWFPSLFAAHGHYLKALISPRGADPLYPDCEPSHEAFAGLNRPVSLATPEWTAALKKTGIVPAANRELGHDFVASAELWKLELCLISGALNAAVPPGTVQSGLETVLERHGVGVAVDAPGHGKAASMPISAVFAAVAESTLDLLSQRMNLVHPLPKKAVQTLDDVRQLSGIDEHADRKVTRNQSVGATQFQNQRGTRDKEPASGPMTLLATMPTNSSRETGLHVASNDSHESQDFLLPALSLPSFSLLAARPLLASGAFEFPPTPPRGRAEAKAVGEGRSKLQKFPSSYGSSDHTRSQRQRLEARATGHVCLPLPPQSAQTRQNALRREQDREPSRMLESGAGATARSLREPKAENTSFDSKERRTSATWEGSSLPSGWDESGRCEGVKDDDMANASLPSGGAESSPIHVERGEGGPIRRDVASADSRSQCSSSILHL
ncbi:HAUS augmin-like complex subunit 6 N-terminus-domain-containing protein [Hyaloraphidium curvatum]|nr:HAUS augmin-like complex subunit 6 N-terminus-domain-containing protein [Hyaloraphidium curvatum]